MSKLQLYYPVKPFIIGQKFGETALLPYYQANGINFKGHNGQDLAAINGEEVRAAHDGVCEVQADVKGGHGVVVTTNETFDYKDGQAYFRSVYWHLIDNIPIVTNQVVKAGDLIGYADSTGLSTGSHLHFSIKPAQKNSSGVMYNIEQDNGYFGAIDQTPYYNGKFAADLTTGKFVFSTDLSYGDINEDVRQLQKKLQSLGYFPLGQEITNFYGSITRGAVFAFQNDYIELTWMQKFYRGKYCAQKTRAALNRL